MSDKYAREWRLLAYAALATRFIEATCTDRAESELDFYVDAEAS